MSQITTHVLDTSIGKPANGIAVVLYHLSNGSWKQLATGTTNEDGRIGDLLPESETLPLGTYKVHFQLEAYFKLRDLTVFYPEASIVININDSSHYHIPLLLSPFGYSTYRGS